MNICDVCGKEKRNVSLQPTLSQLIFGGFRGKMTQMRCSDCEKDVMASVNAAMSKLVGKIDLQEEWPEGSK
jgi:hypothetical protein